MSRAGRHGPHPAHRVLGYVRHHLAEPDLSPPPSPAPTASPSATCTSSAQADISVEQWITTQRLERRRRDLVTVVGR